MICRRCGAELPDNAIRCSTCGLKVNMLCPKCKSLTPFGDKLCNNCGFELLKICPTCGGTNVFSAINCRKCGSKFETTTKEVTEIKEKESPYIEIVGSFSSQTTSYVGRTDFGIDESYLQKETIEEETGIPVYEEKEENKVFILEKSDEIIQEEKNKEPVVEEEVVESSKEEPLIEPTELLTEDIEVEELKEDEEVAPFQEEEEQEQPYETDDDEEFVAEIQPDAVNKAIYLIKNSLTKQIVAINGEEGTGKSAVLKQVNDYLVRKGFLSLYGSCTPLVQITSFGFFQDAFLRMMGFPPYANSTESFIKDFKKSDFAKVFSFLDGTELTLFLNIFYPSQKDNFESILENKKIMFSILEKVLKSFLVDHDLIISIDNFELLDGASYDFIIHLMKNGFFNNRLKMIVAYQENKSIQSYFDVVDFDENGFETIVLKKFSKEEIVKAVNSSTYVEIQDILAPDYLNALVQKSDGNAIRLEQEVALLFDTGYISLKGNDIKIIEANKPEIDPASFEELIKLRLNFLTPLARNVLYMAAIMGYRFATSILCLSVAMPVDKAEKTLDYLMSEMFIKRVDNYTCEFKSLTLWKLIYQEAKSDLLYKENSQRLYLSLKPLILSSNLQKLISCTEALSKSEAFLIWQNTAKITAKLGDTNLYVIAQKQCLKLLEEQEFSDSEEVKSQIYEEIGKLLCEKSPVEAVTYLSNVLDAEIKDSNLRKVIDLSGYFIKSCYLTGNYFGANEAVDAVIDGIDKSGLNITELDIALINTRRLKALLNIGNSEQIINIVNEDIISELDRGLSSKQTDAQQKNLILNAWLLAKIALAKAYALQGNSEVNKVINDIRQFIEKYNYKPEYYNVQADIVEAFSKTVTGEINKSNEILAKISEIYANKSMETNLLAEWNLISIINRVMSGQRLDLKVDLFELAAYTNNINEHFIKNIIKLILGYVIQDEGNTVKALEIYNEQITYFAKEKVAIGALLSWAMIVQITMQMGDDEKAMNTAIKSLEIAQSPKINNYFFIIYFQKYLAEIYLRRGDFVATKMYLEQAIGLAKQHELKYQQIELYLVYAKYVEELMKAKHIYSADNVKTTSEMYNKALLLAKELRLNNMIELVTREKSEFKTFCQLNSINV
ncbi:MAG: zinc ribbon domain-containing protein [Candidatus Gastranaerophilales bacterium]|nr:zinc ribbon domain-containing protein [Candidatus Gastranaerophilales bacterium]